MNTDSNISARLTGIIVSFTGRNRLTLPIRSTFRFSGSALPVRIIDTYHCSSLIFVGTIPITELSMLCCYHGIIDRGLFSALLADKNGFLAKIKTSAFTGASISNARGEASNLLSALFTVPRYLITRLAFRMWLWLSGCEFRTALTGAESSWSRRPSLKRLIAPLTNTSLHFVSSKAQAPSDCALSRHTAGQGLHEKRETHERGFVPRQLHYNTSS